MSDEEPKGAQVVDLGEALQHDAERKRLATVIRAARDAMPEIPWAREDEGRVFRADGRWRGIAWVAQARHEGRGDAHLEVWVDGSQVADVTVHAGSDEGLTEEVAEVGGGLLWGALRAAFLRREDGQG